MTGFVLLDVAIGVVFALLVFGLIASAVQEALASALNWRGRVLRRGLFRLLEGHSRASALVNGTFIGAEMQRGAALTKAVLRHPLIQSLHGPKTILSAIAQTLTRDAKEIDYARLPSSIPKPAFARALLETLRTEGKTVTAAMAKADAEFNKKVAALGAKAQDALAHAALVVDTLPMDRHLRGQINKVLARADLTRDAIVARLKAEGQTVVESTDEGRKALVQAIAAFEAETERQIAAVEARIADWFDQSMDRVIGWYVRRVKLVLFLIGFTLAAVTNFDVIGYAGDLVESDDLRAKMVARAELIAETRKLGDRDIGTAGFDSSAVWLNAETDGTPGLSAAEVKAMVDNPALGAVARAGAKAAAGADKDAPVTPAEAQAAYDAAWEKLKPFDTEEPFGVLSEAEADAAADAALAGLESEIVASLATLNRELGEQGVRLGWREGRPGSWMLAVLSWLIVGLACTLGGQFWFDLLNTFLKVRAAAAGVKTDSEKPAEAGASGGASGTRPV